MVSPFWKQTWVATGVLMNILGLGIAVSYPYSLMSLLSPESDINTDITTVSWLASSAGFTSIFGYFTSSFLMEKYGRKFAHLITIAPLAVGWLLIYFAKDVMWIFIGRLLTGYTAGCTIPLGAVVLGECTSPENRGMFLNLKTTFTCIGITGLHVAAQYTDWRTVALFSEVPVVITIINVLTWPESPSWLASKQRFEECKKNFFWLRGTSEKSMKELEALVKQQSGVQKKNFSLKKQLMTVLNKFKQKNFLKPMFILFIGFTLLEAGGRHSFCSFAMDIIKRLTNETNDTKSFYYVIAMDMITLIGSSLSCFLVKVMKRRTLLFFSGISCLTVLIGIIAFLYLASSGIIVNDRPMIPLSMFILYLLLVNIGVSPIPLAWTGELFPLEHKGVGLALAGTLMSFSMVLTIQTAQPMFIAIGVQGAFLIYAVVMSLCLIYLYFTLPETKDKTLLEIEDFFEHGRFLDEDSKDVATEKMLIKSVT